MPANTLSNNLENNDSETLWDILTETPQIGELKVKASAGDLMENYGDRIIYTDENGTETRITLNPFAMVNNVLKSPEDMLLTGQAFEHMAEKWSDDDRNPSRQVRTKEDGQVEETGWDNATKLSSDSMLGQWIERNLDPKTDSDKIEQIASAGTLMEDYGDRIIYTDKDGNETRLTLNPWAMMDDILDSPDNMSLVGTFSVNIVLNSFDLLALSCSSKSFV